MHEVQKITPNWLPSWLALIEALPHAVLLVDDRDLRVLGANASAAQLTGLAPQTLSGHSVRSLLNAPEDECFWEEVDAGLDAELDSETLLLRADGSHVAVHRQLRHSLLLPGFGVWVLSLRDLSQTKRAEQEWRSTAKLLAATLESTAEGVLVTDFKGRIRHFNRRFAAMWSLPDALLEQHDDSGIFEWMRRQVVDAQTYLRRLVVIEQSADPRETDRIELQSGVVLERVATTHQVDGQPIGRVFAFRDLTETIAARRSIEALSRTDSLTGLPNRAALANMLEATHTRLSEHSCAVLLFNLDGFRRVNETLGHTAGDRVLQEVAERLLRDLPVGNALVRLGADEFVWLQEKGEPASAEAAARHILSALQPPFMHGGLSFTVTASIGIALGLPGENGLDRLLERASSAMRHAKRAGRSGWRWYRPSGAACNPSRSGLHIDHAMRRALPQGRFRVHYQPQISLISGDIRGAEALLRWNDPELGEVSPLEFIPIAEESGFITMLGDWVLREATRQAARWRAQGHNVQMAVNVSALQFHQPGFVEGLAAALVEARLPPSALELELTESVVLHDEEEARVRMQACNRLGVGLALDDFGTGYSGLHYLKRLPIRKIKIDRSFVSGLPADSGDAGIVHAVVDLARVLGMTVLAEGVETEAQRAALQQLGCDLYQGFLTSPAVPALSFERLLMNAPPCQGQIQLALSA